MAAIARADCELQIPDGSQDCDAWIESTGREVRASYAGDPAIRPAALEFTESTAELLRVAASSDRSAYVLAAVVLSASLLDQLLCKLASKDTTFLHGQIGDRLKDERVWQWMPRDEHETSLRKGIEFRNQCGHEEAVPSGRDASRHVAALLAACGALEKKYLEQEARIAGERRLKDEADRKAAEEGRKRRIEAQKRAAIETEARAPMDYRSAHAEWAAWFRTQVEHQRTIHSKRIKEQGEHWVMFVVGAVATALLSAVLGMAGCAKGCSSRIDSDLVAGFETPRNENPGAHGMIVGTVWGVVVLAFGLTVTVVLTAFIRVGAVGRIKRERNATWRSAYNDYVNAVYEVRKAILAAYPQHEMVLSETDREAKAVLDEFLDSGAELRDEFPKGRAEGAPRVQLASATAEAEVNSIESSLSRTQRRGAVLRIVAPVGILSALVFLLWLISRDPPPGLGSGEVATQPSGLSAETCNFIDDNNDGQVDEGYDWVVGVWKPVLSTSQYANSTKALLLKNGHVAVAGVDGQGNGKDRGYVVFLDEQGGVAAGPFYVSIPLLGGEGLGLAETSSGEVGALFGSTDHKGCKFKCPATFMRVSGAPHKVISSFAIRNPLGTRATLDLAWTPRGYVTYTLAENHAAQLGWLSEPMDGGFAYLRPLADKGEHGAASMVVGQTGLVWTEALVGQSPKIELGIASLDGRKELLSTRWVSAGENPRIAALGLEIVIGLDTQMPTSVQIARLSSSGIIVAGPAPIGSPGYSIRDVVLSGENIVVGTAKVSDPRVVMIHRLRRSLEAVSTPGQPLTVADAGPHGTMVRTQTGFLLIRATLDRKTIDAALISCP